MSHPYLPVGEIDEIRNEIQKLRHIIKLITEIGNENLKDAVTILEKQIEKLEASQ